MLSILQTLMLAVIPLIAVVTAGHALLFKRDSRSAFGWIAVSVMFPLVGPALYFMFGINRVRTRAQELSRKTPFRLGVAFERGDFGQAGVAVSPIDLPEPWRPLARLSDALVPRSLVQGNEVEPLYNGEQAYPPMLAAIESATRQILLTTYIFESNATGRSFIGALARARLRGVEVRVLLDGVGELYSWPLAGRLLARAGIDYGRFLPPRLLPPSFHINMRNHRKLLVVDGDVAFIGGMNIGDRHLAEAADGKGVVDVHFRLRGPVVTQIQMIFAEDWRFATGGIVEPAGGTPSVAGEGTALCRACSDGPNEDMDKLSMLIIGASSLARERIEIMTPYFVPTAALISALQTAALRGVKVVILLPEKSNLRFVDWATRNLLWELLQHGVEVRYQPEPFAHSKLFVIDGHYALIGSANIDPRSLRLNFELGVEIFDAGLARALSEHFATAVANSRPVTLEEVDSRRLPVRVRDAICWLFSPYL